MSSRCLVARGCSYKDKRHDRRPLPGRPSGRHWWCLCPGQHRCFGGWGSEVINVKEKTINSWSYTSSERPIQWFRPTPWHQLQSALALGLVHTSSSRYCVSFDNWSEAQVPTYCSLSLGVLRGAGSALQGESTGGEANLMRGTA